MAFRGQANRSKICSIVDCSRIHYGIGYCRLHYARWKRYGDPTIVYNSHKRHGLKSIPEYRVWKNMKTRCYNKNNPAYKNYGGRGIKVCDRWVDDFEAFYRDISHRPTNRHTLERIDNDSDYEPENCKWATRKEQMNNTRINRYITWKSETLTLSQWSERQGITASTIHARLNRLNWSVGKSLGVVK